jgi:hypothetical protein
MAQAIDPVINPAACWTAIRRTDRPLAVEVRDIGHLSTVAGHLAEQSPFERCSAGTVDAAVAGLGDIPDVLAADIRDLTHRFAGLMQVDEVRIRLEGINTNACRKIHADYTDVRLITTYSGPGTEYLPHGQATSEENLVRLPAGHVALFKGRLFAEGHEPCLHRSPPVGDTGEKRLVLVIDTPLDEERAKILRAMPVRG